MKPKLTRNNDAQGGLKGVQKEWRFVEIDLKAARRLAKSLDIPLNLAKLLVARGLTKPKEIKAFLSPDKAKLLKPTKLKGVLPASKIIFSTIEAGDTICVFGDFDVDGLTATTLLTQALQQIGAKTIPFIPDRFDDGYGLSSKVIKGLSEKKIGLIITVDCGISNLEEIALAKELGIKVIVVDHHQPGAELPDADAIINPRQTGCDYPFKDLAGVGLAFKLAQAVLDKAGLEDAFDYIDLVALGTVADMAPLVGENRILVYHGLKKLAVTERPGLRNLIAISGFKRGSMSSGQVSFGLAPRLNASGRMASAETALKLLMTKDQKEALACAKSLDTKNRDRQKIERKMFAEAVDMVESTGYKNTLALASPDWHEGVKGIVASRLVERYFRPTILFTKKDGFFIGSARSIPKFNIFEALQACEKYLVRWGGHRGAAGLTVREADLDNFRLAFEKVAAERLDEADFKDCLTIDLPIDPLEISESLIDEIDRLSPFGIGNPLPTLALSRAFVDGRVSMGSKDEHLRFFIHSDGFVGDAVAFKIREDSPLLEKEVELDLAFYAQRNEFRGRSEMQLKIVDARLAKSSPVSDEKAKMQLPTPGSGFLLPVKAAVNLDPAKVRFIDRRGEKDKDSMLSQVLKQGHSSTIYVRDEHEGVLLAKRLTKLNGNLKANVTVSCQVPDDPQEHQRRMIIYQAPLTTRALVELCTGKENNTGKKLVYLLYNDQDLRLARHTIESLCPDRERLAKIYRALRDFGPFDIDEAAGVCRRQLKSDVYEPATRHLAVLSVKILGELRLLTKNDEGKLVVVEREAKVELELSETWRKVAGMKREFLEFEGIALTMAPSKMLRSSLTFAGAGKRS